MECLACIPIASLQVCLTITLAQSMFGGQLCPYEMGLQTNFSIKIKFRLVLSHLGTQVTSNK
jgi:hypothetical protein